MKKSVIQQLFSIVVVAVLCMETSNAQSSMPLLLGMTGSSSSFENGTIFGIHPDGSGFKVIHQFPRESGIPEGELIQTSDGTLYGMTGSSFSIEGTPYAGTIFKIKADGTGHKILHYFDYLSGTFPNGKLLQAKDGVLYGVAPGGEAPAMDHGAH